MKYREYIESKKWLEKKRDYEKSTLYDGRCWCCNKRFKKDRNFHHRSYKRLGKERLTDLVPVCRPCHEEINELFANNPKLNWWNATTKVRKSKKVKRSEPKVEIIGEFDKYVSKRIGGRMRRIPIYKKKRIYHAR